MFKTLQSHSIALGVKSKLCFPRPYVIWFFSIPPLRLCPLSSVRYVCSQSSKPSRSTETPVLKGRTMKILFFFSDDISLAER